MDPSELINLYSKLRVTAAKKKNFGQFQWSVWKKCYKIIVDKLFELESTYTVHVLEQTRMEYEGKLARQMSEQAAPKKANRQKAVSANVSCKAA